MKTRNEQLTGIEQTIIDKVTAGIIHSRNERSERVQACLEALEETDEVTRKVALISIEHYIAVRSVDDILSKKLTTLDRVFRHAPGVFMGFGALYHKVLDTGEFVTVGELVDSAESLGFKPEKGVHAAGILYHWIAAANPFSEASRMVVDYGHISGKMRSDFRIDAVLFHVDLLRDFADLAEQSDTVRPVIDPIVCLAGTDDWDRATALMTPAQLRKIP